MAGDNLFTDSLHAMVSFYGPVGKSVVAIFTAEIAREAGLLKSIHANIPTGDCIIASTALAKKAKILSDDHHYDEIKGISRTWFQTATHVSQ